MNDAEISKLIKGNTQDMPHLEIYLDVYIEDDEIPIYAICCGPWINWHIAPDRINADLVVVEKLLKKHYADFIYHECLKEYLSEVNRLAHVKAKKDHTENCPF